MKKYAILIVVVVAAFSTLSATFDNFSPAYHEQPIMFENEGNDSFFEHNGPGCAFYDAEV